MSIISGIGKFGIWIIRFFQFAFAVVLTGVFAYFHRRLNRNLYSSVNDVDVPLAFSVIALFFTVASIVTIFFARGTLNWVTAFFDFAIWAGYLASAIVYRHNFHLRCSRSPLPSLLGGRFRDCSLVKLGAALIIIQLILFFITMIISAVVASRGNKRPVAGEPIPVASTEKRRLFGGRRSGVTSHV